MRLNPDCVRDILLEAENLQRGHHFAYSPSMNASPQKLTKYTQDEVFEAIDYCMREHYIKGRNMNKNCSVVFSLDDNGHKALAAIRSNSGWAKLKNVSTSFRRDILDILKQIVITGATSFLQ